MNKKIALIIICCLSVLLACTLLSCAYSGAPIVEQTGDGAEDDLSGQTIEFTVVFTGFEDAVLKTVMVRVGYAAVPPTPPVVKNYTFVSWDGDYSVITSDRTIKAIYQRKAYDVFFVDYNNTVISKQTVEPGGSVVAPEEPIREGYVFKGWDKKLEEINDGTIVNAVYEKSYVRLSDEKYDYVMMGVWPQKLLTSETVIASLNAQIKNGALTPDAVTGLYTLGDNSYARVSTAAEKIGDFEPNSTYYFTVEPIKWRILTVDKDTGVGVLVTDEVIDVRAFDTGDNNMWAESEIRTYLNSFFYENAFKNYEKLMTRAVTLNNGEDSVVYSTVYGEDTEDRVYLFSFTEAMTAGYGFIEDYNVADVNRRAKASDYAVICGAAGEDGTVRYYLRSPAYGAQRLSYVDANGTMGYNPGELVSEVGGIRPSIAVKFPSYTVKFFDEDDKTLLATQSVIEGFDAEEPVIPLKTGYTFSSWSGDYNNVSADISVHAVYTKNVYVVTFVGNDGETIETQEVPYLEAALPPTPPAVQYMEFVQWVGNYSSIKGNTTIEAQYRLKKETVSFETAGGSEIASQEIFFGEKLTEPATSPYRENYVFMGWFGDEERRIPFDFDQAVYQSVVYAGWSEIKESIVYYMRSTTGNNVSAPLQLSGYNFDKWYDDAACTRLPTSYSDDTAYYAKWTVATKQLKLYVYQDTASASLPSYVRSIIKSNDNPSGFSESEVTILEFINGRNVEKKYWLLEKSFNIASDVIVLPLGERVGDVPPQISRRGYEFDGWYTNSAKEGQKVLGIPKYSTEDVTLYACWSDPNVYNILYTLNGGTNSTGNPSSFTIERATFTIAEPVRPGYNFKGWVENAEAAKRVERGEAGATYYDLSQRTIERGTTEGRTFYACWSEPIEFNVEYSYGAELGAELPDDAVTKFNVTVGVTLAEPVFEKIEGGIKSYRQFLGWYNSQNCINLVESIPLGFIPEKDNATGKYTVKLFAKWSTTYLSPIYSYDENDNSIVYFGKFPQTLVTDPAIIAGLDTNIGILEAQGSSNAITLDANTGWYTYQGVEYAVVTASPCGAYRFASAGSVTAVKDQKYYFVVEKIRWKIVTSSPTTMTIISTLVLTAQPYNTIKDDENDTYYATWKNSELRQWLNDEFYNTAFDQDCKQLIALTSVDNTKMSMLGYSRNYECEDTSDYVYVPAYIELTDVDLGLCTVTVQTGGVKQSTPGADVKREAPVTDYAIATGAFMNTDVYDGNGNYWTRSPVVAIEGQDPKVGIVTASGAVGTNGSLGADTPYVGIRPMITVNPKAVVAEKVYTVTFLDADGNVIAKQKVYDGETASDNGVAALLPEKEGYDFIRWTTEYADESKNVPGISVSYSERIYADLVVRPYYEEGIS